MMMCDTKVLNPMSQKKVSTFLADVCVTKGTENGCGQRQLPAAVELRSSKSRREERGKRRRMIDPATCERPYTHNDIEFMMAMDQYKRDNRRPFPTWSEVLEVLGALGYRKVANPTQMPGQSTTMPPKVVA